MTFDRFTVLHPLVEWHEDDGPVLWWWLPVSEPPYSGTPLDKSWPGIHTHWSFPIVPYPTEQP